MHYSPNDIRNLLTIGTRDDLISWLCWNDSNGVYTDEDSIAENMEPLTLEDARELVRTINQRDAIGE